MISHYWAILELYVTNHTWMRYLIPSNKPFQRYYFSHQSLQHLVRPWHFFMPELELMKGQVSEIRFSGRNGSLYSTHPAHHARLVTITKSGWALAQLNSLRRSLQIFASKSWISSTWWSTSLFGVPLINTFHIT